jgi:hypothetical protein
MQCPDGAAIAAEISKASWLQVSSGPAINPTPPAPVCPLPPLSPADLPASAADMSTAKDYYLLDYELFWWYGHDYDVITWQNQYDQAIYKAGVAQSVPPRLLKGIFGRESQFWPLWTPERHNLGEIGLGQLTDYGADLAMHYSPGLYNQICPIASLSCWKGYELQTDAARQMMRDILRGRLVVTGTPRQAALQATYTIPVWAQILAAYYCAAGEIVYPAGVRPSWDYAAAAYHSGLECVRGGDICPAGQSYLNEVKQ